MNHCLRCAAEPWVKESGTTRPVAWRCSVSSPIALAVVSAASMSPASRKFGRFFASRLTQTPDRQAGGLQFDLDLERIGLGLRAGLLLQPRHARNDAEQVLDVMAGLMRDDVGGGEIARRLAGAAAEARLDLAEESGVEEDGLVGRAIE